MSNKKYAYVLSYDDEVGKWDLDIDLEEQRFKYGTIYNNETEKWEYAYIGEGKFNADEEKRTGQISLALKYLNNLTKEGKK